MQKQEFEDLKFQLSSIRQLDLDRDTESKQQFKNHGIRRFHLLSVVPSK